MPAPSVNIAVAGLILAGGRSVRFGSEKAAALLHGRTLLQRALDRLPAGSVRAVSARPGSRAEAIARAAGAAVLHDAPGDPAGPLAGIRAGLGWAGAAWLAVAPCDAPFLPADLNDRLAAALGDAPAAFAETEEGPQPLCALWTPAALPALTAALSDGAHPSVWRFLDGIGAARVRFTDAAGFHNINTPADLAALQ